MDPKGTGEEGGVVVKGNIKKKQTGNLYKVHNKLLVTVVCVEASAMSFDHHQ